MMMTRPGRGRSAREHRVARALPLPRRASPQGLSPLDELRWPAAGSYGCDVQYQLAPGRLLTVERVVDEHDCPLQPGSAPVRGLDVPADVDPDANAVHFAHEGDCWTVRIDDECSVAVPIDEVVAMTRALLP